MPDRKKFIKRRGYLWSYYGFSRLHLWGVHIVCSALAAAGAGFFVLAILRMSDRAPGTQVELFLKFSGIAFLGCLATAIASILSLLFFWGAHQLGLLEEEPPDGGA